MHRTYFFYKYKMQKTQIPLREKYDEGEQNIKYAVINIYNS